MDSLFIKPRDENELEYITDILNKIDASYRHVTKEAAEEFELAMMIKDKTVNTAGIIRQEMEASKMTMEIELILEQSDQDIKDKLIVTERKIQHEEDEWLNQ